MDSWKSAVKMVADFFFMFWPFSVSGVNFVSTKSEISTEITGALKNSCVRD